MNRLYYRIAKSVIQFTLILILFSRSVCVCKICIVDTITWCSHTNLSHFAKLIIFWNMFHIILYQLLYFYVISLLLLWNIIININRVQCMNHVCVCICARILGIVSDQFIWYIFNFCLVPNVFKITSKLIYLKWYVEFGV